MGSIPSCEPEVRGSNPVRGEFGPLRNFQLGRAKSEPTRNWTRDLMVVAEVACARLAGSGCRWAGKWSKIRFVEVQGSIPGGSQILTLCFFKKFLKSERDSNPQPQRPPPADLTTAPLAHHHHSSDFPKKFFKSLRDLKPVERMEWLKNRPHARGDCWWGRDHRFGHNLVHKHAAGDFTGSSDWFE